MRKHDSNKFSAAAQLGDNDDYLSSGYVTIDDQNEDEGKTVEPQLNSKKVNEALTKIAQPPLLKTHGLPYTAVFRDLEPLFAQIEEDFTRSMTAHPGTAAKNDKEYVRFSMVKDLDFNEDVDESGYESQND